MTEGAIDVCSSEAMTPVSVTASAANWSERCAIAPGAETSPRIVGEMRLAFLEARSGRSRARPRWSPSSSFICADIWLSSCTTLPEPEVPVSAPELPARPRRAGEALAGALDVGQQRQRAERIAMRLVEIGGVVLERDGEMLLDRRRTGERRRIQPGRHGDDHRRADRHDADQRQPRAAVAHLRQEADQIGPEAVDGDRDGDGIDDGGEEDDASPSRRAGCARRDRCRRRWPAPASPARNASSFRATRYGPSAGGPGRRGSSCQSTNRRAPRHIGRRNMTKSGLTRLEPRQSCASLSGSRPAGRRHLAVIEAVHVAAALEQHRRAVAVPRQPVSPSSSR